MFKSYKLLKDYHKWPAYSCALCLIIPSAKISTRHTDLVCLTRSIEKKYQAIFSDHSKGLNEAYISLHRFYTRRRTNV